MREATALVKRICKDTEFQSTPPRLDATLQASSLPRAELRGFNPRLPYGRRHAARYTHAAGVRVFQSTPPWREATATAQPRAERRGFNPRLPCGRRCGTHDQHVRAQCFNPRLPCGRRQGTALKTLTVHSVSIHASHAGGDSWLSVSTAAAVQFQSTPPMREATGSTMTRSAAHVSFNPRLPCGRRPCS